MSLEEYREYARNFIIPSVGSMKEVEAFRREVAEKLGDGFYVSYSEIVMPVLEVRYFLSLHVA